VAYAERAVELRPCTRQERTRGERRCDAHIRERNRVGIINPTSERRTSSSKLDEQEEKIE
jgi:hypothetical protein